MYQVRQEYDLRFLCSINLSKFSLFIRVFYLKFDNNCSIYKIANAVDQISVEWNTDPLLLSTGIVKLVYQNIPTYANIFIVSLPSSILGQGNQKVS
jgi:hypothetical protein